VSPEPDSHWVREDSSLAEGLVAPQAYNGGDYGADLLPLAERVRRAEVGTSEADEGTGEGEPAAEAVGG
jgi:hypothetical protein